MTDPLSVAAGIVGIVVPALHGARLLVNDLERITGAPEAIAKLRQDADAVKTNLDLLQAIGEEDWALLGLEVTRHSKATIESCDTACNAIREDLQRWTKRSKGGSLSWHDRVNVGFFKDHQLKAHSTQLQTYKLTLSSIVGTASLYGSFHNARTNEELRQAIGLQHTSTEVASHTTGSALAAVELALAEVRLGPTDGSAVDDDEQDVTITSLQELQETIRTSQILLRELISKAQEKEVAKAAGTSGATTVTFGADNKGNQWGVVNGSVTLHGNR